MSYSALIDSAYQATRMPVEEEADYERQRSCKHPIPHDRCEAALEDTLECEGGCGKFFCPDHLYNGACKACFEAAEAEERMVA